jgi:hypothetical protein
MSESACVVQYWLSSRVRRASVAVSLPCVSLVADPDKSQAYFQTVEEAAVPAGNVVAASSAEQVKSAVSSGKAVVVYHYSQVRAAAAVVAASGGS